MIALIFCGDLKYCPYMKRYVERLEAQNSEYCVLFWNRGGYQMTLPSKYYFYNTQSNLNISKIKKIKDFLNFRKWLLSTLKKLKPKKIVVLSTLTGIILGKYLYKKERQYIFDIRDYSYEHIPFFYAIEKKIIKHSYFTAISSKGFKSFLPKHDYVIAHNFNRGDIQSEYQFKKKASSINFVWNGVVRYFDFQKKYLDALKNDERFKIIFHGDGPQLETYKKYCQDNGFANVEFTGAYDNNSKEKLLKDAHILNNCYGYEKGAGNKLKHAVSNRFYDGLIFHIPQLVEPDGYKSKWVISSEVGVNFQVDEKFADKLYQYYHAIDVDKFNNACKIELQKIIHEDDEYINNIDAFIKNEHVKGQI